MPNVAAQLNHTVIPAVPVPFRSDGAIDDHASRTYAQWMAQQSVGGVAVWAHTGRGLLLTDAQRAQVLAAWKEALSDTPIICGVGVPESEELPTAASARTDRVIELSVRMAESARDGGASAVLLHPPTRLRDLGDVDRRVIDVHRAVAQVGLSVIAFYLYDAAGGIAYASALIDALLDLDRVIGIKLATLDSVMTFQDIAAVVTQHADKLLITGEDRFLGYSLMMGADAALIGMAAACTDRCASLLAAWFGGIPPTFARLVASLDSFSRITFTQPMDGYVQRMLWALEEDGVIASGALDPFAPVLADSERAAVQRAVRELRSQ